MFIVGPCSYNVVRFSSFGTHMLLNCSFSFHPLVFFLQSILGKNISVSVDISSVFAYFACTLLALQYIGCSMSRGLSWLPVS